MYYVNFETLQIYEVETLLQSKEGLWRNRRTLRVRMPAKHFIWVPEWQVVETAEQALLLLKKWLQARASELEHDVGWFERKCQDLSSALLLMEPGEFNFQTYSGVLEESQETLKFLRIQHEDVVKQLEARLEELS